MQQVGAELVRIIDNQEIFEYDIQPIESGESHVIVDSKYLLVNKLQLKSLYFKWRGDFLSRQYTDPNEVTKLILMVNPNFLSAWSLRKQLITDTIHKNSASVSEVFKSELKFSTLILLKHFKCEQAYVHRRWLIRTCSTVVGVDTYKSEVDLIVESLSRKIKANYYCWTYFNWLIQFFDQQFLIEYSKHFANVLLMNPSDFCVFHSRLNLIKTLVGRPNGLDKSTLGKVLINEISLIEEILLRFPSYSTIWNYSKYFLILIKDQVLGSYSNLDFLSVDALDKDLNTVFIENIRIILDDSQIINVDLNRNMDPFGYLISRAIWISLNIPNLLNSHPDLVRIQDLGSKCVAYLEKFLKQTD